ncbi:tRNA pseudouridine(38-40) synthase TruA [Ferrovibrio sp.]|uniref:tRNA pseudouridine(38-40) synthase TruA n=1 Tax=Ferrovibrio sp. TaxID=1917215 RepID=UPI0035B34A83
MPRYRLTIEYHGGGFVGWQRQASGLGVQQVIEEALHAMLGQRGPCPEVFAAGRTDAGVHARGQVVHVDLDADFAPERLLTGLNFHLRPRPVSVLHIALAEPGFNARLDATARHYLYRILDRHPPPGIEAGLVWHVPVALNAEAMHEAARHLLGHHDFSSFRAAECQAKSPMRTLAHIAVRRMGPEIHVSAQARSFLHHQVRIMVGTLKLVGEGKWQPGNVAKALAAADRRAAGPTAPPDGLCLTAVDYF